MNMNHRDYVNKDIIYTKLDKNNYICIIKYIYIYLYIIPKQISSKMDIWSLPFEKLHHLFTFYVPPGDALRSRTWRHLPGSPKNCVGKVCWSHETKKTAKSPKVSNFHPKKSPTNNKKHGILQTHTDIQWYFYRLKEPWIKKSKGQRLCPVLNLMFPIPGGSSQDS